MYCKAPSRQCFSALRLSCFSCQAGRDRWRVCAVDEGQDALQRIVRWPKIRQAVHTCYAECLAFLLLEQASSP